METHKLTIDEIPKHRHGAVYQNANLGPQGTEYAGLPFCRAGGQSPGSKWFPTQTQDSGEYAHNNLPPYFVIKIWKRTS